MTDERSALCTITATEGATRALDRLRGENGPLVLHITAGAEESGSPMCLPAHELTPGPRDVYLGTVHGVEVYEMRSHVDRHFRDGSFVLTLTRGLPVGFSLPPEEGMRFAIRGSVIG